MNNSIKSLYILSYLIILLVLTTIRNEPIQGYELSIYSSIPFSLWILLFFCICFAASNCVSQSFKCENDPAIRDWRIGILLLILIAFIFISLPALKGYLFYGRGDTLTHLGLSRDIILFKHIGTDNNYPIAHLFIATMAILSNIPLEKLIINAPVIFSLLYLFSIFLLTKQIIFDKRLIYLIVLIGILVCIKGVFFSPMLVSLSFIVFFFYVYLKDLGNSTIENRIILIILAIIIPFMHALSSGILLFSISLIISIKTYLENKFQLNKNFDFKLLKLPLILFIVFIFWLYSRSYLLGSLAKVLRWIIGEQGTSQVTQEAAVYINKYGINVIEISLKMYGSYLIYFILAGISIYYIYKQLWIHNQLSIYLAMLYSFFLLASLLQLFHMVVPILSLNLDRMIGYMALISPILAGFTLYNIFIINSKHRTRRGNSYKSIVLVSIIVITTLMGGLISMHPSTYRNFPGHQVTDAELDGMSWFLTKKNQTIDTAIVGFRYFRFADAILGTIRAEQENIKGDYNDPSTEIGNHFKYDRYDSIGYEYSSDKYLLISEYDMAVQFDLFSYLQAYTLNDFKSLGNDKALIKLYNSNGFVIWKISALNRSNELYK